MYDALFRSMHQVLVAMATNTPNGFALTLVPLSICRCAARCTVEQIILLLRPDVTTMRRLQQVRQCHRGTAPWPSNHLVRKATMN